MHLGDGEVMNTLSRMDRTPQKDDKRHVLLILIVWIRCSLFTRLLATSIIPPTFYFDVTSTKDAWNYENC